MGAQPATLMTGLVAATQVDRHHRPDGRRSPRRRPAPRVANGTQVTVTGTATDAGGAVAGVEVSTDGGATWHPATGTTSWTLHLRPARRRAPSRSRSAPSTTAPTSAPPPRATVTVTLPVHASSAPSVPAIAGRRRRLGASSSACGSPRRSTASSPASASTRAPATPAPTPARCGAPPAQRLATVTFTNETATRLADRDASPRRSRSPPARPTSSPTRAPNGHYAVQSDGLLPSRGVDAPPAARSPAASAPTPAGVYADPGHVPGRRATSTANYYVDVAVHHRRRRRR